VLTDLIPLIRFPLMTVSELSTYVIPLGILAQDDMLGLYTYIAAKGSKMPDMPKLKFSTKPRASFNFEFKFQDMKGATQEEGFEFTQQQLVAVGDTAIPKGTGVHRWDVRVVSMVQKAFLTLGVTTTRSAEINNMYMPRRLALNAIKCIGYVGTGNRIGNTTQDGMQEAYGKSYGAGDVISMVFDSDSGTLTCLLNGESQGVCGTLQGDAYPFAQGATGTRIKLSARE